MTRRWEASSECTTRNDPYRSFSASFSASYAAYELANSVSPPDSATCFADSTVAIWGKVSSIGVQPSMCQSKVPRRYAADEFFDLSSVTG